MKDIDTHIAQDRKILDDPQTSPQQRRHIEGELHDLEEYKERHPDDNHDPTPLELYCDQEPGAPECKMHDN